MRYICEPDIERRAAGWGEHWWIIDTERIGDGRLFRLLPETEAKEEARRLNSEVSRPTSDKLH